MAGVTDSVTDPSRRIDFFIAGGQKCGTTALDAMLRRHPDLQMARRKEPHFFDEESQDWSAPDYTRLHSYFDFSVPAVRGESTPIYTFWPQALERVRAYNPDARLVMVLRHPARRAFSQWKMEITRERETLPFGEAIREGRDRAAGQRQRYLRRHSYVERGHYAAQVRRLLDLFGPEQVYFARTDHLWTRSEEVVGEVLDHLGVARRTLTEGREYVVPLKKTVRVDPLSDADRTHLQSLFADDIRATAALTGLDLDDWLDPDYQDPMSGS